ncbi:hypothetical protein FKX85_01945 [Echinicola soli]|uniref:Uncharacterized protein n=1 Tax=Echinicola soli TaxID=2591634 RepID=A0A514CDH7_9BACT|nr:hypothetical protein [Echinicola soli]QDH77871.1 hypothetical protein FKX85_01945 [Echinicola soli]
MKKIFVFFIYLSFSNFQVMAQNEIGNNIIDRFISSIEKDKISLGELKADGIIRLSESNEDSVQKFDQEYAQPVFEAIRNNLEICNNSKENIEILSLKEAKARKKYFPELISTPDGDVYLLYCKEELIAPFLVQEGKISSFSTLNKSGKEIFLLL